MADRGDPDWHSHVFGGGVTPQMAQRHTVYLKRSARGIAPEQILASIRQVEWALVAEVCEVTAEQINEADESMRIENFAPPGFIWYKLHYRPGNQRPVDIERWRTPGQAKGVIEEVIDNLDPEATSYEKVRAYLKGCIDTVHASYGSNLPGEAMAPILASQVCLWLAQQLGGIIRDPCGDWYEPTDGLDLAPL